MRLIRLRVRNIASLKGEHEIDFLEIQRNSSLFAITGETGSGKSSILNSIGLALYGQIYKKNVNQLDVVTLGEKDGSIELIFQVKDKFYLADWKARVRKQNGEPYSTPQTPVRNLYVIEGAEFTSPRKIAEVTSPELLNLDFDQFCKCIILNQGEFARFLTSSFTDRKDILEKLYPGELLDNISRELDLEKKALEKTRHELEIELQTLRGDNQSGDHLKAEKEMLEQELGVLEKTSSHFEKIDYHFTSLFSYHKRYNENEQRKKQIKDELSLETTKYNLLLKTGEILSEKHESIKKQHESDVPVLQTYLEKEGTLKLLEENHAKLKIKLGELEKNLKNLQEKIEEKESEERDARTKLAGLAKDITLPIEDLKQSKDRFQELFDLFGEKELLTEEIKGKKEKLSELEIKGTELSRDIDTTLKAINLLPSRPQELEKDVLKKKTELQKKADEKQRSLIASEELSKQIKTSETEIKALQEKISALNILISKTREDILPCETTLKLAEVLNATEVCVEHAISSGKDICPVCETEVPESKWTELKQKLATTDFKNIRKKFEEGSHLILKSEQEAILYQTKLQNEKTLLADKEKELIIHLEASKVEVPSLIELDQELDSIRKKALDLAQLKKESDAKKRERDELRILFKKIRDELIIREEAFSVKNERLTLLSQELKPIIPVLNRDSIRDLKAMIRLFNNYIEEESHLQKITREKGFLQEKKDDSIKEFENIKASEKEHAERISDLQKELETALKGEKASVLIQRLNDLMKEARDQWTRHLEEQNKQEQTLKNFQGKLYTLDELTKDFDLQFTKELHILKDLGSFSTERVETRALLDKIGKLDLGFQSPKELFIPLEDYIKAHRNQFKEAANECRMKFASVSTKLTAWEKLQDKILLLEIKAKDINEKLDRKLRLFEVLGKDELRTFVLSLVEENLIYQTNEELQKLCQGRYEIIHQTKSMKMTPEFFILDKYREGGKRKVSTLSGGETFMVSLAMALGLAEMTRGQAEIDSLFIDEGFGTLDQDSLEDVLDMLQQIQTRGLMVGIISHIKTLTNAIPVNLVLTKRQDGTSTVSVIRN